MSGQFVFSPLSWSIVLLLLLVVIWRLPRALRYAGIAIEVLVVLSMTPLGANLLVRAVESRAPSAQLCATPFPTAIVLLSGGFDRPPESVDDFSAANSESLHRLFAAVELWRRSSPGSTLIIAGGGEGRISQAALLARLAEELGVPPRSIREESDSLTTWQNAQNVAAMSPPVPRRIWLVSSAMHLPRATGAFRAFGFDPCAWSSGTLYLPPGGLGYFMPQSSSLEKAEFAIHEVVGGWIYTWKARNAAVRAHQNR